jgi:hypothetical protein
MPDMSTCYTMASWAAECSNDVRKKASPATSLRPGSACIIFVVPPMSLSRRAADRAPP